MSNWCPRRYEKHQVARHLVFELLRKFTRGWGGGGAKNAPPPPLFTGTHGLICEVPSWPVQCQAGRSAPSCHQTLSLPSDDFLTAWCPPNLPVHSLPSSRPFWLFTVQHRSNRSATRQQHITDLTIQSSHCSLFSSLLTARCTTARTTPFWPCSTLLIY